MATRLEESLERDIDRIRQQVLEMSALAERALRDCVEALTDGNRQRAYAVILRDQYIDEKEKEIDRLCLEFLVRQQPVGVHLRLAYSTIKINLELERVGDYAESIARQLLRLSSLPAVARADPRADRRDGRPRHPDAPRLDRGLRPPGPRARQEASSWSSRRSTRCSASSTPT